MKDKKSVFEVMFAVACGVLCGWFVGRYLAANLSPALGWLAWLGCVTSGGIVGYIVVDPWWFCVMLPAAVRSAWSEYRSSLVPSFDTRLIWAFRWRHRGTIVLILFANLSWAVCAIVGCWALVLVKDVNELYFGPLFSFGVLGWFFHSTFVCFEIGSVNRIIFCGYGSRRKRIKKAHKEMTELREFLFLQGNSVLFCLILVPYGLFCAAMEIVPKIWSAACLLRYVPHLLWCFCSILWHAYRLTHTSKRLITMGDAVLFSGVAYFTSDIRLALTCAVVGALWGAVNLVVIAPWVAPKVEPLFVSKE